MFKLLPILLLAAWVTLVWVPSNVIGCQGGSNSHHHVRSQRVSGPRLRRPGRVGKYSSVGGAGLGGNQSKPSGSHRGWWWTEEPTPPPQRPVGGSYLPSVGGGSYLPSNNQDPPAYSPPKYIPPGLTPPPQRPIGGGSYLPSNNQGSPGYEGSYRPFRSNPGPSGKVSGISTPPPFLPGGGSYRPHGRRSSEWQNGDPNDSLALDTAEFLIDQAIEKGILSDHLGKVKVLQQNNAVWEDYPEGSLKMEVSFITTDLHQNISYVCSGTAGWPKQEDGTYGSPSLLHGPQCLQAGHEDGEAHSRRRSPSGSQRTYTGPWHEGDPNDPDATLAAETLMNRAHENGVIKKPQALEKVLHVNHRINGEATEYDLAFVVVTVVQELYICNGSVLYPQDREVPIQVNEEPNCIESGYEPTEAPPQTTGARRRSPDIEGPIIDPGFVYYEADPNDPLVKHVALHVASEHAQHIGGRPFRDVTVLKVYVSPQPDYSVNYRFVKLSINYGGFTLYECSALANQGPIIGEILPKPTILQGPDCIPLPIVGKYSSGSRKPSRRRYRKYFSGPNGAASSRGGISPELRQQLDAEHAAAAAAGAAQNHTEITHGRRRYRKYFSGPNGAASSRGGISPELRQQLDAEYAARAAAAAGQKYGHGHGHRRARREYRRYSARKYSAESSSSSNGTVESGTVSNTTRYSSSYGRRRTQERPLPAKIDVNRPDVTLLVQLILVPEFPDDSDITVVDATFDASQNIYDIYFEVDEHDDLGPSDCNAQIYVPPAPISRGPEPIPQGKPRIVGVPACTD